MHTHPLARKRKKRHRRNGLRWEVQDPIVVQKRREEVISGRMVRPAVPEPADQNS